ncbi:ribosome recycling factor [Treponema phagedenis]|uniref:Ribosome-recycling factor n=1 Tax=Treponema phagedenis TaxID=162 RepID=A0A0B7GRI9_TREPH|nr:ribosome recycling factor [Treponema phagedenis]EFW39226.1 ribosome recycling factor [Treponema phagedenis F0421]NVP23556.1 ribosome recycling factor [Treponema phagedenis]QEJ94563.1 ribosome recycling factor [Treponema phagedenis]QEJ98690.1 ribosome recycling factor [Treponema phagedenis]QEK01559.1 ribosome recycling factor [Treponema phagedenis]
MNDIHTSYEEKMKKSIAALKDDFNTLRTGRASASLFEKIRVECYGELSPLNQVASISIPEARLVVIQPWDKSLLPNIEKAILKSELSLNPSNDGKIIRIAIPPLTEDRRKELAKQAKNIAEQSRIAIRNIRRDGIEEAKKLQKEGSLSEDDLKTAEEKFQKATDAHISEINTILAEKEKEILDD